MEISSGKQKSLEECNMKLRKTIALALAAALAALGVLLYGFRDRTLSDEAREALIFGGPERR